MEMISLGFRFSESSHVISPGIERDCSELDRGTTELTIYAQNVCFFFAAVIPFSKTV